MNKTRDTIRKAAILIDTLDPQTADALLDQMDAAQAARIRNAVMNLREVDPIERDQIVKQFLGGSEPPPVQHNDGVELDGSLAAKIANGRVEPPAKIVNQTETFRSLHEATGKTLASFLKHEHPQTVAVVVANLTPSRAADVVGRFPPELQADVLSRVSELDETDPEIIQEIEREIQSLLADEVRMTRRRSAGLSAVRSILAAADHVDRDGILANLAQHDKTLAAQIDDRRTIIDEPPMTIPMPKKLPKAPPSAEVLESCELESRTSFKLVAEVSFADLADIDDNSLNHILRVADPAMTMLALTGAKQEFVERITRQLPNREAKQLRKKMQQSGPLRLSDVDHAQNYLAKLAAALAAEGKIRLASPRKRFAAAA